MVEIWLKQSNPVFVFLFCYGLFLTYVLHKHILIKCIFAFHQDEMTFILANRVEDVLRAAFDDEFPGMAQATSSKL